MPLTPADVRNIRFSKPPIGKRGYDEDSVDNFLALVVTELARLIEQNNDLRNLLEQRDRQHRAPLVDTGRSLGPVQPPGPLAGAASLISRQASAAREHDSHAAKVLGLAQQIADRLTSEARQEADGILDEARTRSEQLLAAAQARADGLVSEARTRAESLLKNTRTRAESLELQSREKAASIERDAARKHDEIIGSISREKDVLEKKVDDLRAFEREYRTLVKAYLESQLEELDLGASAGPASAVPADSGDHRTDPEIGRAAADVARLPARNVQLNPGDVDEAGMNEIQREAALHTG